MEFDEIGKRPHTHEQLAALLKAPNALVHLVLGYAGGAQTADLSLLLGGGIGEPSWVPEAEHDVLRTLHWAHSTGCPEHRDASSSAGLEPADTIASRWPVVTVIGCVAIRYEGEPRFASLVRFAAGEGDRGIRAVVTIGWVFQPFAPSAPGYALHHLGDEPIAHRMFGHLALPV